MDVRRLRIETRIDHEAAEASLPLMRMGLGRAEYVFYLQRLQGMVAAWEDAAGSQAGRGTRPEWLRATVNLRQRRSFLEQDLVHFGQFNAEFQRPTLPEMHSTSSLLGAMYVMEGSTLGGQIIGRHVDRVLGLAGGKGSAYFHGHGELTGAMWKEFCGVLETRVPEAEGGAAVAAAKALFQVFSSWMQGGKP